MDYCRTFAVKFHLFLATCRGMNEAEKQKVPTATMHEISTSPAMGPCVPQQNGTRFPPRHVLAGGSPHYSGANGAYMS